MKSRSPLRIGSALVLGFCIGLTGCARAPREAPAAAPVTVTASYPAERDVTDYAEFTARIAAVDSVEVRAHVWGYLDKVNFREGALVNKGDVLLEIDPRTYRAVHDQAQAQVALAEAQFKFRDAQLKRNESLASSKAVSREELEQSRADRDVAAATIGAN